MAKDFWEVWRWKDGKWDEDGNTDTFDSASYSDTYGYFTATATVDFYRNSAVTADNPYNWVPGDEQGIPSGSLRATTNQPSWWTGSGFNHNAGWSWE